MIEVGSGQPKENRSRPEGQQRGVKIVRPLPYSARMVPKEEHRFRTAPRRCRSGEGAELPSTLREHTNRGFVFEPVSLSFQWVCPVLLKNKRVEKTTVGKHMNSRV